MRLLVATVTAAVGLTLTLAACGSSTASSAATSTPASGSPAVTASAPTTSAPAPTDTGVNPTAPSGDPGVNMSAAAEQTQAFADGLIGMPEAQAIEAMKAATPPYVWRIAERDGEKFALTMDYSPTRINLRISDGVITEANVG